MLDQNTDRMWYVIGAVLIGAAIIFGMNTLMPEAFASVSNNFNTILETVSERITYAGHNLPSNMVQIPYDELTPHRSRIDAYDEESGVISLTLDARTPTEIYWYYNKGIQVARGYVLVPYNHKMTLSYEVYVPDDGVDYESRIEINNFLVDEELERWNVNDFDNQAKRSIIGNGVRYGDKGVVPLKNGEWNTMSYSYVNNDPQNTTQSDIYDTSRFGVRNHLYEPIEIQIRNIRWSINPLD